MYDGMVQTPSVLLCCDFFCCASLLALSEILENAPIRPVSISFVVCYVELF